MNTMNNAGWTQLSTNVWTKGGYTLLLQGDLQTMISPIGKRVVRRVSK